MLDAILFYSARDATALVSFAVAISTSQTYILDSGARRIALLPAQLHGGSPTCCCGSGSLQVWAGIVVRGWAKRATILLIMKKGYKQVKKKISNEIKRM